MASSLHIKSLPTIYLGSTSPRRKELLLQAGFKVKVFDFSFCNIKKGLAKEF